MASSSSSVPAVSLAPPEDIAPLPLIRCPRCNLGVIQWFISETPLNPGRHFYKCQFRDSGRCTFWKWENKYIDYLCARWSHVFLPIAPPPQEVPTLIMREMQSNIKIALAVALDSHEMSAPQPILNEDPDPLDDPDFFNIHPTGPTSTSRTSVQKVLSVTSQFDEYKVFLVQEIGWGGILKLRPLPRMNLKFSKWVMNRVDTITRSINLDNLRTMRFYDVDVHKVFGIPCGQLDIALHEQPNETTVNIIRATLGMPEKGNQILKVAEKVLCRPLSEKLSSTIEKDSFKMALVIFVMGHLLTPTSKHDAAPIDYWAGIVNPERISDFNWCEYVLQDLLKAVSMLKADILNNRTVTHLEGCHIFLQCNNTPKQIEDYSNVRGIIVAISKGGSDKYGVSNPQGAKGKINILSSPICH
ncbi:hypothetical protein VPH35_137128 [Triticum aestivum]